MVTVLFDGGVLRSVKKKKSLTFINMFLDAKKRS